MKHEWRKSERGFYLPKRRPEVVSIPNFRFAVLEGQGNPNSPFFARCIEALYGVSYTLKMSVKKSSSPPEGYLDYTVYPLEGLWSLSAKGREEFNGVINKDELVFRLMIRQPDWVSEELFLQMRKNAANKKGNGLIEEVNFETIEEKTAVQMLHVGPYDDEPATFRVMEEFCEQEGLTRFSKDHREIYLSDFRKTAPEKLKTVLRFQAEEPEGDRRR